MKQKTNAIPEFQGYTHLFERNADLVQLQKQLVPHRVFKQCAETILTKIAHPASFNIVPVVGPSGAGKTQLLTEVAGELLRVGQPNDSDTQPAGESKKLPYLPFVVVLARNGRTYESRYRALLIEILEQVNEVLVEIGKTISNDSESPIKKSTDPLITKKAESIAALPIARLEALVSSGLQQRRVRAVLIDEAQHLVPLVEQKKGYGPEFRLIADGLKVLGINSRTLIVLFGTAELLNLPNLTAQLGRRSQLIHFRRYLWQDPDDQAAFKWVVEQFAAKRPTVLPREMLVNNLSFLYAGSLGCVGVLSDWLGAAVNRAAIVNRVGKLKKGKKTDENSVGTVTLEILKETALRGPRLRKIHSEATDCEVAFAGEKIGPEDLIEEFCLGQQKVKSGGSNLNAKSTQDKNQGNNKPGKRSPTYDSYQPAHKGA
jgi:hypothetical protein